VLNVGLLSQCKTVIYSAIMMKILACSYAYSWVIIILVWPISDYPEGSQRFPPSQLELNHFDSVFDGLV